VSQSASAISIAWSALDPNLNGGSPVTDYKIYINDPSNLLGFVLLEETTKPNFVYTANGLSAGLYYRF